MDQYSQKTYLVTLSHLRSWKTAEKNDLLIQLNKNNLPLSEFYYLDSDTLSSEFNLSEKQILSLKNSEKHLTKNAMMIEDMENKGFSLIALHDNNSYPSKLKQNLGLQYCPCIIYSYGDINLFQEPSVAIVGSRSASDVALTFTDNISQNATNEMKVVVSGFAKGVDRRSLDATLDNNGRAIIVLPQGILTAGKINKDYYAQINQGDVLVVSAFYPSAPWSIAYAMARNPYIYGLGEEIYVAESDTKGGTWSGAIDGLRKNRKVFVRNPEKTEKNGNIHLIHKGCEPVDINGNPVKVELSVIDKDRNEQQKLFE